MIELKTFIFLDSLQPQLATFIGTTANGFLPSPYDASLFVEIARGIAINRVTDTALKATKVRPAYQIVERAFGMLEVHHPYQGEVKQAGDAILKALETQPASYIAFAANEAEKAANISLVEMVSFGAFGRLYFSGTESEVDSARD